MPVLHATRINDLATARHAVREQVVDLVGDPRPHRRSLYRRQAGTRRGGQDPQLCRVHLLPNYGYCIQNPATAREAQLAHVIRHLPRRTQDRHCRRRPAHGGGAHPRGTRTSGGAEASAKLGGQVLLAESRGGGATLSPTGWSARSSASAWCQAEPADREDILKEAPMCVHRHRGFRIPTGGRRRNRAEQLE